MQRAGVLISISVTLLFVTGFFLTLIPAIADTEYGPANIVTQYTLQKVMFKSRDVIHLPNCTPNCYGIECTNAQQYLPVWKDVLDRTVIMSPYSAQQNLQDAQTLIMSRQLNVSYDAVCISASNAPTNGTVGTIVNCGVWEPCQLNTKQSLDMSNNVHHWASARSALLGCGITMMCVAFILVVISVCVCVYKNYQKGHKEGTRYGLMKESGSK